MSYFVAIHHFDLKMSRNLFAKLRKRRLSSMRSTGRISRRQVSFATVLPIKPINVSTIAKDFISALLNPDPAERLTSEQAMKHPVGTIPLWHLS